MVELTHELLSNFREHCMLFHEVVFPLHEVYQSCGCSNEIDWTGLNLITDNVKCTIDLALWVLRMAISTT